ncbi:MAG: RNA methyltransferase [Acidobacteria bacterium]|nr:RNA methyltransferase [Acidobacteriota bacterium]
MMRITVQDLHDERLDPYRNLKTARLNRRAGLFVAEGEKVVQRLLASDYEVISVLVSDRREADIYPALRPGTDLMVIQDRLATQLVGFKFHGGVMACGRRKPQPDIASLMCSRFLVGCSRVDDPENLGSIIRLCAVFGVEGLFVGRGCADPFSRRVLRVSMGNGFRLPVRESRDLRDDLTRLKQDFGFQLLASVTDPDADPLGTVRRPPRTVILFGNEAHGLEPDLIALCDRRVTVPMKSGTDSLNVAVAAGILLYHFR